MYFLHIRYFSYYKERQIYRQIQISKLSNEVLMTDQGISLL
jgi:hypothetical protein